MNGMFVQTLRAFSARSMQFVVVCSFLFVVTTAQEQRIIVVSNSGHNNESCLNSNGSVPCQTLDFTLQHFGENPTNSTRIEIESGHYNYSLNLTFSWLQDFAIQVKASESPATEKAVINCSEGAGFSFENSVLIRLHGITFEGCGASHMSTTGAFFKEYSHANFSAAIFLADCEDLFIDDCDIVNSPGIGVNLYDVGGTVNISRTMFEGNGPHSPLSCPSKNCTEPGGGVYIELTRYGGVPPWQHKHWRKSVNGSFYLFHGCNFTYNRSPQMSFEDNVAKSGFRHIAFGRGGAVSMFLYGYAHSNAFHFEHCSFMNNEALYGAGLFVEFHDQNQNNSVKISDCLFQNNTAELSGGAVRSGSVAKEDKYRLQENKIIQTRCNYTANMAIFGGAVSHYGLKYFPSTKDDLHEVLFSQCNFNENKGTVGSAIGLDLNHGSEGKVQPFSPFYVLFEDCTISNNAIILTEDGTVIGQGSLYTHSIPVIFKGTVRFENNTNMSALVLDNSLLYVHDRCIFQNNTGLAGGAMALYGESQIMTMANSNLVFENNRATEKGGAIYVQTPGPPIAAFKTRILTIHECFLAHENQSIEDVADWKTNIYFTDNFASGSGNSVYATTLKSCFMRNDTRLNNRALMWPVVTFNPPGDQHHIGTDPVSIKVVPTHWRVAPTEVFNADVQLRNERNKPCSGTIRIDMKSSKQSGVRLNEPSPLFLIPQNGHISNIQLKGIPKSQFTVTFKTLQGQLIEHTIKSTMKDCYPGYKQSASDNKSCECLKTKDNKFPGIVSCGDRFKEVYLKPGFWFGKVSKMKNAYATFSCPEHYCYNSAIEKKGLVLKYLYKEEQMCAKNRNGTLCGECKHGTNLLLGSEECVEHCNTLQSLSLLGFVVGAIIIILFLLLFDLTVIVNYMGCWLFSYQVMDYLKYEGDRFDSVITVVIDLSNWRIPGVGMCINPGMTEIQKLGFNYLLPLSILVILVILTVISERRPQCYYQNGTNVYPAYAVLLVLCYTNVVSISFKMFHWVPLYMVPLYMVPLHMEGSHWVLFNDGTISVHSCRSDAWCIVLSVIAAVWLVLLIPFPFILAVKPEAIRNGRKIRNFCAVFQDCFRDGKKWFASVYFFLRIVVIIIAMFVPAGTYTPLKRTALDILTVAILVTFVYLKPYNEKHSKLNKLEAVLLGNLSVFSLICSNRGIASTDDMQKILRHIIDVLAYGPLAYFIGIIIYLTYVNWNNFAERWAGFKQKLIGCCQCGDIEDLLDFEYPPTSTGTSDEN